MKKSYLFLSFTIVWMILIFYFSSRTATDSSGQSMFITERIIRTFIANPSAGFLEIAETVVRKAAHFTEYFIMGWLVFFTIKSFDMNTKKLTNINLAVITIIICFLYAVSDEVHQYFVPGRACRILDILIDTLGSSFFCLMYFISIRIFRNNS